MTWRRWVILNWITLNWTRKGCADYNLMISFSRRCVVNASKGIDELIFVRIKRRRSMMFFFSTFILKKNLMPLIYEVFFSSKTFISFTRFSTTQKKHHLGWYGDIIVLNCANKTYPYSCLIGEPILLCEQKMVFSK